jgi:hypothetical protein
MVETEKQKIRREYERKESQVEVKKKMCVRDRSTIPRANDRSIRSLKLDPFAG